MYHNRNRKMRRIITAAVIAAVVLILTQAPLPYYYIQPGSAASLSSVVEVEEGAGESGEMYLTTVYQQGATPALALWSVFSPYRELSPKDSYQFGDESEEEFFERQRQVMESSQESAEIAAYEAAGKTVNVKYRGVRASDFIDGMDAAEKLEEGDLIQAVNGREVQTLEELNNAIEGIETGEKATIAFQRNKEQMEAEIAVESFPASTGEEESSGLGILYPYTERSVSLNPEATIDAGSIGGPSAGLMFALEVYNQLTEEDITGGKKIAGTGTIDEQGEVGPIGGIDKKIVAADKKDIDVFFAPDAGMASPSNYEIARQTARSINSDMKVVPVATLEEAVEYLKNDLKKAESNS
ncbi:SepM family pheromone-processing serine protease [Marinococcus halophilus]|uniref:endopeptidase La n=1 Tax=Marinococcus halophilus TaxID=1371 RepID=A0A510Y1V5_MARHA|nr:SepM family pheromone-processing serine protease [Marinococcus halophilus]GEK57302.1 hypothetical protein MHA01_02070 [Marinococcus halophilus]